MKKQNGKKYFLKNENFFCKIGHLFTKIQYYK